MKEETLATLIKNQALAILVKRLDLATLAKTPVSCNPDSRRLWQTWLNNLTLQAWLEHQSFEIMV
jgi:hypothetical protein